MGGLFRGFLLVVLIAFLRPRLPEHSSVVWAVVVSSIAFAVGHLGNLGYVTASFVLLQVVAGCAFGMLAGFVKVRMGSLVGPVLLHSAMNVMAVV